MTNVSLKHFQQWNIPTKYIIKCSIDFQREKHYLTGINHVRSRSLRNNLNHFCDIKAGYTVKINKVFNQQNKTHIKDDLKQWSGWNARGADETTKQLSTTLQITQLNLSGARAERKRE